MRIEPFLVIELVAITAMYDGGNGGDTAGAGGVVLPPLNDQVPPHAGGLVLVVSAQPPNEFGADATPFRSAQSPDFVVQYVTTVPVDAFDMPITKEPWLRYAKTITSVTVDEDAVNGPAAAKDAWTECGPRPRAVVG